MFSQLAKQSARQRFYERAGKFSVVIKKKKKKKTSERSASATLNNRF